VNATEDPQFIGVLQTLAGCSGVSDLVRRLSGLPGCRSAAIFGANPDGSPRLLAAQPADSFDAAEADGLLQLQSALYSGQGARAPIAAGATPAEQLLLPLSLPTAGVLRLVVAPNCGFAAAPMLPLLRTVVEHALNGAQLAAAQAQLAQAQRERDAAVSELETFLYSISHDLRNPVNVVRGLSNLAHSHYAGTLDDRGQDYLKRISGTAGSISTMLEGLLQLSRLGREPLQTVRTDSGRVVKLVLAQNRYLLDPAGVAVQTPDIWPLVNFPEQRLLQVLGNLVSNAVKYMGARARPQIDIGWRQEAAAYAIWVRDNGVGITPEQQLQLFKPFYRAHTVTTPGIGLGLSIVKRIVDLRGGALRVSSEPGRGSEFLFTVPLQAGTEAIA
jgi:signal transduction histidine kinase